MSLKRRQPYEIPSDNDEEGTSSPLHKSSRVGPADDQLQGKGGADKQRQGKGRETNAVGAGTSLQVSSVESDRSSSTSTVVAHGSKSDASPQSAQPKRKKQEQEKKQAQMTDWRLEELRMQACAAQLCLLLRSHKGLDLPREIKPEFEEQSSLFTWIHELKLHMMTLNDTPGEITAEIVKDVFSLAQEIVDGRKALGRRLLTEDDF